MIQEITNIQIFGLIIGVGMIAAMLLIVLLALSVHHDKDLNITKLIKE
jgi:hypothetical protein